MKHWTHLLHFHSRRAIGRGVHNLPELQPSHNKIHCRNVWKSNIFRHQCEDDTCEDEATNENYIELFTKDTDTQNYLNYSCHLKHWKSWVSQDKEELSEIGDYDKQRKNDWTWEICKEENLQPSHWSTQGIQMVKLCKRTSLTNTGMQG